MSTLKKVSAGKDAWTLFYELDEGLVDGGFNAEVFTTSPSLAWRVDRAP